MPTVGCNGPKRPVVWKIASVICRLASASVCAVSPCPWKYKWNSTVVGGARTRSLWLGRLFAYVGVLFFPSACKSHGVYVRHVHTRVHRVQMSLNGDTDTSHRTPCKSLFSFDDAGPENWTHVISLGNLPTDLIGMTLSTQFHTCMKLFNGGTKPSLPSPYCYGHPDVARGFH